MLTALFSHIPPLPRGGGGGGGGGEGALCRISFGKGVPLGLSNPYPIPDHVQLILQPNTRLDTLYPIPCLRLAIFWNCSTMSVLNGKPSVNNVVAMIFFFTFRKASFSSEFLILYSSYH